PFFRSVFQPLFEHLLRTASHHVEQTCRSCALADRGEVDDDGDVLVTTPGVPPYMLVDTNDADPVETGRVVDQQPLTFSEDGGVRGVPGHGEFRSDDGHGVVIDDEGTQRPVEAGSRDLRSWWRRSCGVLTPDAATLDAFVTAEANVKRGWSVAERFVGQLADDGVANDPVAAAPSAPVISSVWLAFQDGLLPGDVLAGAGQIEGVESAECRKVRGRESRLGHVEVFRMDCVRTSIIGRPRRLSAQRRAVSWNHRSTLSFTKSRIPVLAGTVLPVGALVDEVVWLHRAGLSAHDAVGAASWASREVLDLSRLRHGDRADLI